MSIIPESELILNEDNSVYHLGLHPGDMAKRIITVGDQHRVKLVSKYFDFILLDKQTREFRTITGEIGSTAITVISTGIGTDNIDIVLNEVDALFNIDFSTKQTKENHTSLEIMRLGTSGSIQQSVPVDSLVISKRAVGLEGLMHLYNYQENDDESKMSNAVSKLFPTGLKPVTTSCSDRLLASFQDSFQTVNTVTATGFYAPQGRQLRLVPAVNNLIGRLSELEYSGEMIHNLEMETSGIYGLSKLLGHDGISISAILANRISQKFSNTSKETVDKMIKVALQLWVS